MSDFILEINEPAPNLLLVDSSFNDNVTAPNLLSVDSSFNDNVNIDIINTEKVLVGDLPDNIPFSKISGNIDIDRIDNLGPAVSGYLTNNYIINVDQIIWADGEVGLGGYLSQFVFDGGGP